MASRTNKTFIGYKTCPDWLKKLYRKSARYTCQQCNKHEDKVGKLTPHRLKRKTHGGLYTIYKFSDKRNNIKLVCLSCHKSIHSNEPGHGSHSY